MGFAADTLVGSTPAVRIDDASRLSGRREAGLALAIGILVAIFALRVVALGFNATDLYMDEAQYWAWAQELALGYYSKPPLVAWIIHATTAVCGDGEVCVRFPAVVLHFATAVGVYLVGSTLYSRTVGLWSSIGYALLPAVSLSSGIVSTDVPLLTAWAFALYAFVRLMRAPSLAMALLLGLALGVGLNAKYAMAYFIACAGIVFLVEPQTRAILRQPHLWLALGLGFALIAPNLIWNATHGFVTFAHSAENANWGASGFKPHKALEFLVAQFGVFGPIAFGALVVITVRSLRSWRSLGEVDRLLLLFSVPIIAAVTLQGFVSRAHANWAAPAYVAAIVLVTATMLREGAWRWLAASLVLNAAVAVVIAVATANAGRLDLPVVGDPFARTLGNRALAEIVRHEIDDAARAGKTIRAVATNDREMAAALSYYGRDLGLPILAIRDGALARSHFELRHAFGPDSPAPVLLVTAGAASPPPPAGLVATSNTLQRIVPRGRRTSQAVSIGIYERSERGER